MLPSNEGSYLGPVFWKKLSLIQLNSINKKKTMNPYTQPVRKQYKCGKSQYNTIIYILQWCLIEIYKDRK